MKVKEYFNETTKQWIVIQDEHADLLYYSDINYIPSKFYNLSIISNFYSGYYGTDLLVVK